MSVVRTQANRRSSAARVVAVVVLLSCSVARATGVAGASVTGNAPGPVLESSGQPGTLAGSQFTAVAAGAFHTCALRRVGTVVCWGSNYVAPLGNGTTEDSPTPTDVSNLTDVTAVAAAYDHSCAVNRTGKVLCWGFNDQGQLGVDTSDDSTIPIDLYPYKAGFTAIASGYDHSCGLDRYRIYCWGINREGQLGNGTTEDSAFPIGVSYRPEVKFLPKAVAIAVGRRHSCAIHSTGRLTCWGDNTYGQLGDGTTLSRSTVAT